jgi:peroxiredoxin
VSDTDGRVAAAYGARRPPGSRWATLPERRTFLVDPAGVVRAVYDVTDVHGHAAAVLDDLHRLRDEEAG